jgi:predicted secreted hydrolase
MLVLRAAGLLLLTGLLLSPAWASEEAAHPSVRSEWWDLAGHLRTSEGETFGLLVAFRRGEHAALGRGSLLTLVVIDLARARLLADVNLIDGPFSAPGRLRLSWEGSRLERLQEGYLLDARGVDDRTRIPLAVRLTLEPLGPPALLAGGGLRPFGPSSSGSFFQINPSLRARGSLRISDARYPVEGLLWFSHLWGPFSAAGKAFRGRTTWLARLEDGRAFRLDLFRGIKASGADRAQLLWFGPEGVRQERLSLRPEVLESWRSPRGISYPVAWRLPLKEGLLSCRSRMTDGEVLYQLKVLWVSWRSFSWVGSCLLEGTLGGKPAKGEALVEATGF